MPKIKKSKKMSLSGTVKWFNREKGFGFISPNDGGADLFVHQSAVTSNGYSALGEGDIVQYDTKRDRRRGNLVCAKVTVTQAYRRDLKKQPSASTSILGYFDLETTGLAMDCEIIQIAAISYDGTSEFNIYVLPTGDIHPEASKVNGFTKVDGNLVLHGEVIKSVDIESALKQFLDWLLSFDTTVVLIGHNAKNFDTPRLLRAVTQLGMKVDFEKQLAGFVCSLELFREKYPGLEGQKPYSQMSLYQRYVKGDYDAHDALNDVRALKALVDATGLTTQYLYMFSFTW